MTEPAAVLDLKSYQAPKSTVVIIDDQSTGRMVLTEIMRVVDPRITVVPFSHPGEAIAYVDRFPIDMVVTDYMMPRMDGVQTTRELRARFGGDELPIVMTTIVHSRDLMYRAFEAGVSEYLLRPVDPIECRLRFENLLARRRSHVLKDQQIRALGAQVQNLVRHLDGRLQPPLDSELKAALQVSAQVLGALAGEGFQRPVRTGSDHA